ncbi:MAG: 3-phosphoshikimate 1-carboxyvinyltransferase [Frankiales bacterium]|nr:3-phosphoshikimate 1-carboxyvinyltransferase [Frankiales bacterium]
MQLPGSKSQTNRALVLAALSDGASNIRRPLRSRDTTLMVDGLRNLGIAISGQHGDWVVTGGAHTDSPTVVDVGNAGTVARFLPPVAAFATAAVQFDGDPRMRARPLGPLIAALRDLGVRLDDDRRDALPFTVHGTGRITGGAVRVDASASSQLVSGLLLTAPRYDVGVDLTHVGAAVPSAPHIQMTVDMLRRAGATVDVDEHRWRVAPSELHPREWVIEPDLSSAAPFVAAAVVTGGSVRIPGWPTTTTQPGGLLPDLLAAMGAAYELNSDGLTIRGPDTISGIDADLRACSELVPVIAAVAAVATSPSRLRGIAHMRLQETDRLAALATEIGRLGGDVRETEDGLEIRPQRMHGGTVKTYDDHRIVMAAAVLGLVVPGVQVENAETVAKTLPEFTDLWAGMLAVPGGES